LIENQPLICHKGNTFHLRDHGFKIQMKFFIDINYELCLES
jgi:hypothetical protein